MRERQLAAHFGRQAGRRADRQPAIPYIEGTVFESPALLLFIYTRANINT